MTYIFGPVPSRRLGRSLGIDLVPMKTCTLSCQYCQIGETPETTIERKSWVPDAAVLDELRDTLAAGPKPDWITFSGSGEPTLNSDLGALIHSVKDMTDVPICVITNGTLLWMPEVREALLDADAVMPSLDSAIQSTFDRICQPHQSLAIDQIIDGLAAFRDEYTGTIWLEILFVKGLNDSDAEIDALKAAVDRIRPDAVHLNTVVRPPAENGTEPVSPETLNSIKERFGECAEIIASFDRAVDRTDVADERAVVEYLKRRPGYTGAIADALNADETQVAAILERLVGQGAVRMVEHFGKQFWEYCHRTPAP